MKFCIKCSQYKEELEFNKCDKNKDGLQSYCRDCQKIEYYKNIDRKEYQELITQLED